jgi:hypothetical protein
LNGIVSGEVAWKILNRTFPNSKLYFLRRR